MGALASIHVLEALWLMRDQLGDSDIQSKRTMERYCVNPLEYERNRYNEVRTYIRFACTVSAFIQPLQLTLSPS